MSEFQYSLIESQQCPPEGTLILSRRKEILFSIIACIGVLFCLEVAVRIGAYFLYNRSPYFLFYGLKPWMADDHPEGHSASFDGYFKFPPSRVLHQYGMFQKPTPIRINSLGFRGADFSGDKPQGIFRIICLGGSSTFGFFNRDAHTYPALLEQLLIERLGQQKVEVINAGIPHANSDNLASMFRKELLRYHPDLITIYSGFNDAARVMDANPLQKVLRWMHSHLATYAALKRLVSALGGPELYSRWTRYRSVSNRDYVNRQIELHVDRYNKNIRDILSHAQRNGIRVALIKQPIDVINNRKGERKEKMSYEEEVLSVKNSLSQGKFLSANEITLLVHYALMESLEAIAGTENIPIVDNVSIVDEHPEYYASYVHLTEDGNKALAEAIYSTICPLIVRSGGLLDGGSCNSVIVRAVQGAEVREQGETGHHPGQETRDDARRSRSLFFRRGEGHDLTPGALDESERATIIAAFQRNRGNVGRAADKSG